MAAMILSGSAVQMKGFGSLLVSSRKRLMAAWRSTTERNTNPDDFRIEKYDNYDWSSAGAALKQAVEKRFPPGTDVADLRRIIEIDDHECQRFGWCVKDYINESGDGRILLFYYQHRLSKSPETTIVDWHIAVRTTLDGKIRFVSVSLKGLPL